MTGPLSVGLLGASEITTYHLRAWKKVADAAVVAICATTPGRATAQASAFEIPHVYTDARTMFEAERLDCVDIATPTGTHADLTRLAASFGVPVLCQKPLAPTFAEAASLAVDVRDTIRLMVHENRRFAPHYRQIRAWIDDGRVGTLQQCLMTTYRSSLVKGPDGQRPATGRASYYEREKRLLIGGALIHQLDVLRFLLGPLNMVAARALRTEPDLPSETLASLLLVTSTAAPVVVAGNFVTVGLVETASTGRARSRDRLEILGSRGSVVLDGDTLDLFCDVPERRLMDEDATYQACFDGAIAHFVERLRSGAPFETSPEDNLETLKLVEDAYALASA